MRKCPKCGSLERNSSGRCKPCVSAYAAAYRAANADKMRELKAKWHKENADKVLAKVAAFKVENPEKVREYQARYYEKNREKIAGTIRAWQKANPEKMRINCHNRRAKLRAGGKLSSSLSEKLYRLQKGKCACCGEPLGNDYQLDHIMPIALGGANTDDNIQLLRRKCNRQKSAKHPVDFMRAKGFLL